MNNFRNEATSVQFLAWSREWRKRNCEDVAAIEIKEEFHYQRKIMESCGLGILCCLRRYQQPRNPQPREVPQVQLDTGHMGEWFQHCKLLLWKEPVCFSHFDWSLEWFNLRSYVYFFKSSIWFLGNEVVIVKSGKRICGSGAALANAAILQNKCYFEMKIQSGGKPIKNGKNLVPY